eukprot:s1232_g8.t1
MGSELLVISIPLYDPQWYPSLAHAHIANTASNMECEDPQPPMVQSLLFQSAMATGPGHFWQDLYSLFQADDELASAAGDQTMAVEGENAETDPQEEEAFLDVLEGEDAKGPMVKASLKVQVGNMTLALCFLPDQQDLELWSDPSRHPQPRLLPIDALPMQRPEHQGQLCLGGLSFSLDKKLTEPEEEQRNGFSALPDSICQLQISVGTVGLHPRAPDPSGHCRTSIATARSQWALPDFNREFQIPVKSDLRLERPASVRQEPFWNFSADSLGVHLHQYQEDGVEAAEEEEEAPATATVATLPASRRRSPAPEIPIGWGQQWTGLPMFVGEAVPSFDASPPCAPHSAMSETEPDRVEAREQVEEMLDLQVLSLQGDELRFRLPTGTMGHELYSLVRERMPCKAGAKVCIHHLASKLLLEQSLGEQGLVNAAQLSCVYVAINLQSAVDFLQGKIFGQGAWLLNSDTMRRSEIRSQFALEGLTTLTGVCAENCLRHLPRGLRKLTLSHEFDRKLERVILPSTLETLTFGARFNQSLDISLPTGLHSLTFGKDFNQTLEHVTFPCGLRSLTFGRSFNCRLQNVILPSSLQTLTLGGGFVQSFQGVTLPDGLLNLTFGAGFNQNLDEFSWPCCLQNLTFGELFDQSLDKVAWPSNLQVMTFGAAFNQSLERVAWPCSLRSLTLGEEFNQSLQDVRLAGGLIMNLPTVERLTLGKGFHQPLPAGVLPATLRALTLRCPLDLPVALPEQLRELTAPKEFNQPLQHLALPSLQRLVLGGAFEQALGQCFDKLRCLTFSGASKRSFKEVTLPFSLERLTLADSDFGPLETLSLPCGLKDLTLAGGFNQRLQRFELPSDLQRLTLGDAFDRSLEGVALPDGLHELTFGRLFDHSLADVTLPDGLQILTLGEQFNQSMEHVKLPSELRQLTLGCGFRKGLVGVTLPSTLHTLEWGRQLVSCA